MSQNSVILKLIALPIAIFVSCMGIMTILGGHITPGGGFQGGAMITAGVILCILVYGLDKSPINFSHNFVDIVESFGILVYIGLGLGFPAQLGNCVGRIMGCFQYFFTLNFLNMSKIKFHEALFFCQDGCDVEAFNNDVIYLDGWFMLNEAEQIKTYIKSHLVSFDLNDVSL